MSYLEESYHTPNRQRDGIMTRSQFLTSSMARSSDTDRIVQTFFRAHPFERYSQDKSRYRPVSHQAPDRYVQSRSYIAVDEKVDYGKPISQAELDRILKAKRLDPEIITYGLEGYKEPTRDRRTIQVKKQSGNVFCGCCGGNDTRSKQVVYTSKTK